MKRKIFKIIATSALGLFLFMSHSATAMAADPVIDIPTYDPGTLGTTPSTFTGHVELHAHISSIGTPGVPWTPMIGVYQTDPATGAEVGTSIFAPTVTVLTGSIPITTAVTFSGLVPGLHCGTTYNMQARLDHGSSHIYSDTTSTFTTPACISPSFTTTDASDISDTGATFNATVSSMGTPTSYIAGFDYETVANLTIIPGVYTGHVYLSSPITGPTTTLFNTHVDLSCGTTYKFRAFLIPTGTPTVTGSSPVVYVLPTYSPAMPTQTPVTVSTLGCSGVSTTWTGPTTAPPAGNVATPINVSSAAQSKLGSLSIGNSTHVSGLSTTGNTVLSTTPGQGTQIGWSDYFACLHTPPSPFIPVGTLACPPPPTTPIGLNDIFHVEGDSSYTGKLGLQGDFNQISGNANLSGNTSIGGNLGVAGSLTQTSGPVTLGGSLTQTGGPVSLGGSLTQTGGPTSLGGNLNVAGNINATGTLTFSGGLTTSGPLSGTSLTVTGTGHSNLNGQTRIGNDPCYTTSCPIGLGGSVSTIGNSGTDILHIFGNGSHFGDMIQQGNYTLNGNLTGTGNYNRTGTMTVTGALSSGAITAPSITTTGPSALGSLATNALSATSLAVSGDALINGNTALTGNLTQSGGNTSITGTFTQTGNSTFAGNITVPYVAGRIIDLGNNVFQNFRMGRLGQMPALPITQSGAYIGNTSTSPYDAGSVKITDATGSGSGTISMTIDKTAAPTSSTTYWSMNNDGVSQRGNLYVGTMSPSGTDSNAFIKVLSGDYGNPSTNAVITMNTNHDTSYTGAPDYGVIDTTNTGPSASRWLSINPSGGEVRMGGDLKVNGVINGNSNLNVTGGAVIGGDISASKISGSSINGNDLHITQASDLKGGIVGQIPIYTLNYNCEQSMGLGDGTSGDQGDYRQLNWQEGSGYSRVVTFSPTCTVFGSHPLTTDPLHGPQANMPIGYILPTTDSMSGAEVADVTNVERFQPSPTGDFVLKIHWSQRGTSTPRAQAIHLSVKGPSGIQIPSISSFAHGQSGFYDNSTGVKHMIKYYGSLAAAPIPSVPDTIYPGIIDVAVPPGSGATTSFGDVGYSSDNLATGGFGMSTNSIYYHTTLTCPINDTTSTAAVQDYDMTVDAYAGMTVDYIHTPATVWTTGTHQGGTLRCRYTKAGYAPEQAAAGATPAGTIQGGSGSHYSVEWI